MNETDFVGMKGNSEYGGMKVKRGMIINCEYGGMIVNSENDGMIINCEYGEMNVYCEYGGMNVSTVG